MTKPTGTFAERLEVYMDYLNGAGFHVQPIVTAPDGTIVFQDRSGLVLPELMDYVGVKGKSVMCIGGNSGHDIILLLNYGANYVCALELEPEVASLASVLLTFCANPGTWQMNTGSIESFRSSRRFPVVYMAGVLYHLENPIAGLRRAYDLLEPGGQIALETMGVEGERNAVLFYPTVHPSQKRRNFPNYWVPTENACAKMMELAGFTDVHRVKGVHVRMGFVGTRSS